MKISIKNSQKIWDMTNSNYMHFFLNFNGQKIALLLVVFLRNSVLMVVQ